MSLDQQNQIFAPFPNTPFDVVAIGASVGGLEAISKILSRLPAEFPAAIVVVQHLHSQYPSTLVDILSRRTLSCFLPCSTALNRSRWSQKDTEKSYELGRRQGSVA